MATSAVADRYRPFLPGQQKLTGLLANRMQANIEGYLEHVDPGMVSMALAAARDAQSPSEPQLGMLIDAASTAYENSRDTRLKSDLDRVAARLLQTQNAGGYLGAYAELGKWQDRDFVVHRGDLLGLLAYYRVTKLPAALEAAKRIGDSLLTAFQADSEKDNAAVGFLEPMAYLYHYTADPRYLDFCKRIARPLATSAAINAAPSEEGLSKLLGFAELYRLTGDGSLLDAATTGWKELHDAHLSLAGTVMPDPRSFDLGSQCTVAAWFQLTLDLLRLTGNARYGDELERTIYNALLAAQDPRTGNMAPSLSLAGAKTFTNGLANCLPCESLAISGLQAATWGRYGRGIAVIQYSGGRAAVSMGRHQSVQLYSEGSFPESGDILLHIDPSRSITFPLLLRVPDWAAHFVIDCGNFHLFGKPGEFLVLNREWHRGDTVKISMDLTVQSLRGDKAHPDLLAIQRGPQLLALGKSVNPELEDLQAAGPLSADSEEIKLTPADNKLPPTWPGDQAYSIRGKVGERTETITLLPFADALSCAVWLRKPATAHVGSL